MDPLVWAALLLALGFALAILEFFIPSGGILGVAAAVALLAANGMAFRSGAGTGLSFLAVTVLALPLVISVALKIWPHTRMGRRLLLGAPTPEEVLPDTDQRRLLKSLIGKVGRAKSLMMPSGAVEVEGHSIDAVSEGMAIDPGTPVRIVEVHGLRVIVRPTRDEPPSRQPDDPLARPIDTIGADPFDEPLA
jgi:membrane-bound ClpP family serine protease